MAAKIKAAFLDESQYVKAPFLRQYLMHGLNQVVRTHAQLIRSHIEANMRAPKHGRRYPRPGGRVHIASAPGEAPAVDTGNLIRSIRIDYGAGAGYQNSVWAFIGTWTTHYAGYLEEGTPRMAPRPFAQPAYDAYADRFADEVRATLVRMFN